MFKILSAPYLILVGFSFQLERLSVFMVLNVDRAAFCLLFYVCQDTLLTVDNEAQWCFVLSKPCALCSVRFLCLSVCLVSLTHKSRSGE